jgi:hypothetical protein
MGCSPLSRLQGDIVDTQRIRCEQVCCAWRMLTRRSNDIGGLSKGGLRCLQLNTTNNYSVAAGRVAVAAELDKFSRNMNDPAERFSDRRSAVVYQNHNYKEFWPGTDLA